MSSGITVYEKLYLPSFNRNAYDDEDACRVTKVTEALSHRVKIVKDDAFITEMNWQYQDVGHEEEDVCQAEGTEKVVENI